MRLIDADALDDVVAILNNKGRGITRHEYKVIEGVLFAFPAIDAVEVVRCKECKHRDYCYETVAHTKEHDGFREHWSEPIEWCSKGERREP